jgi:type II secretory pathway pseudopilin PulG
MMRIYSHNKGETIVEVLIVIAILSSVLGSAFAITTKTVNNNRQSQEHSEAVGYAQDQLERLKSIAESGSTLPSKFCISSAGVVKDVSAIATIGQADSNADVMGDYPAECQTSYYRFVTVYDSGTKTYKSYVRWDSLNGNTRNNVQLSYRPYALLLKSLLLIGFNS